jgi:hypothetical protein
VVGVGAFRAGAFCLCVLALATARAQAQTTSPPPSPPTAPAASIPQVETGFVSPYEIMKTVRSAGFDPLAPPLREGTTYVLRATDFRGILMRVVVDARTGAIRDVNRVVPGPGRYGQLEMEPSPYNPPGFEPPMVGPDDGLALPLIRPPQARSGHPTASGPPLPRPRPAALASRRRTDDVGAKAGAEGDAKPGASAGAQVNGAQVNGAQVDSDVIPAAPAAAAAPVAPKKSPAVVPPLND